jgi:hypothetical protein
MDANRFDDWARKRAKRLSRRDAIRLAGAGGAAATMPAIGRHALAQSTCSLSIHAETAGGPSAPAIYDGTLQFSLVANGALTQATFSPISGASQTVTGQITGRAIDFQIALSGNQLLSLSGVADQPLSSCQASAAGMLSGPQPGDLGAWQATPAASSPTVPATSSQGSAGTSSGSTNSCPAGQTLCNAACIDTSTDPNNCGSCGTICDSGQCSGGICGNSTTCTPDGEVCRVPADCCSLLCPHDPQVPGVCGCSQVGGVCQGGDDCCQQGGDSQIACLGGDDDNRCIVLHGACSSNADCLTQNCVNGSCASACNPDGEPCNSSTDCCSKACGGGICGCGKLGQSCNEDVGFSCCEGAPTICFANVCCILSNFPCSADADCCDYIQANGSCTNGICTRNT